MMTNSLPTASPDGSEIELGEDILGIRGPVDIPTGWEWLWWTLGALIGIALLYFLIKKLLAKVKFIREPKVPVIPPHVVARDRLAAALRLIGDPYRFCSAVSDALREYVEGRFEIHAPDRTTDEFLEELRGDSALTSDQQDLMAAFLNQCDLVKFAKDEPSEEVLKKLHGFALGLVEDTMPGVNETSATEEPEVAK